MTENKNWIEEAEKRQSSHTIDLEQKKLLQQEYIEENSVKFHFFIDEISMLIKRVNNLPYEEKKPSLELGMTEVDEAKIFEFYGSAYIYKKTFFSFFTGTRYKMLCWRRISFKITDHKDIVKVHINEKYTEKDKGALQYHTESKDKYKLKISRFDSRIKMLTIDWLTFKCTNHDFKKHLPFAEPTHEN